MQNNQNEIQQLIHTITKEVNLLVQQLNKNNIKSAKKHTTLAKGAVIKLDTALQQIVDMQVEIDKVLENQKD